MDGKFFILLLGTGCLKAHLLSSLLIISDGNCLGSFHRNALKFRVTFSDSPTLQEVQTNKPHLVSLAL